MFVRLEVYEGGGAVFMEYISREQKDFMLSTGNVW